MVLRYKTSGRNTRPSPPKAAGIDLSADAFLSAPVAVQKNGMTLSVLSMLCRQDLDPSVEVKHLSGLTRAEAVSRLAKHILNAPTDFSSAGKASVLASALLSLLPAFQQEPALGVGLPGEPATGGSAIQNPATRPPNGHMNYTRLLIAVIACVILIIIGIVDPKSIVSPTGTVTTSAVATATAPAASGQPRL